MIKFDGDPASGEVDDMSGFDEEDLSQGDRALSSWHSPEREDRNTLLMIDDDVWDREYLKNHLQRLLPRYDILEAESAIHAIDLLKNGVAGKLAKIFVDNQMPNLKGVDFVRVMRGEAVREVSLPEERVRQLRHVPVSLISGDKDLSEASELVHRGFLDHVIRKPASPLQISLGVGLAVLRNMGMKIAL